VAGKTDEISVAREKKKSVHEKGGRPRRGAGFHLGCGNRSHEEERGTLRRKKKE